MSLRLRLILAFFLLSVVPLGALTFYVHQSNAEAMRETAGRETELLAGELSQRMQVVTARLTEQVEHLVELAESNEAATERSARLAMSNAEPSSDNVGPHPPDRSSFPEAFTPTAIEPVPAIITTPG